ncbi:hypothetical protein H8E88_06020 [candidate division KSB1 bacterium]|nr:hypothetical protein [candidate division KSB1 bacterium]MBL7095146.1 hypothetical protein [candidate division KSB1 bacterium]
MKYSKILLILILIFLVFTSCAKLWDIIINPPDDDKKDPSFVNFDPMPYDLNFGDDYSINADKTYLSSDTLIFEISHSGGCEEHFYEVRFNRVENQTAYIFVYHNGNGDMCEAYLTSNLKSNLQTLLVRDDFADLYLLRPNQEAIKLR